MWGCDCWIVVIGWFCVICCILFGDWIGLVVGGGVCLGVDYVMFVFVVDFLLVVCVGGIVCEVFGLLIKVFLEYNLDMLGCYWCIGDGFWVVWEELGLLSGLYILRCFCVLSGILVMCVFLFCFF